MIKIEMKPGTLVIEVEGSTLRCNYELYTIGKKLTEKSKELASTFILGMADHLPKEEMLKMVDAAYASGPTKILDDFVKTVLRKMKEEEEQQNENH